MESEGPDQGTEFGGPQRVSEAQCDWRLADLLANNMHNSSELQYDGVTPSYAQLPGISFYSYDFNRDSSLRE
jgi:hypothetical protein